jgi:hypothetical protein
MRFGDCLGLRNLADAFQLLCSLHLDLAVVMPQISIE